MFLSSGDRGAIMGGGNSQHFSDFWLTTVQILWSLSAYPTFSPKIPKSCGVPHIFAQIPKIVWDHKIFASEDQKKTSTPWFRSGDPTLSPKFSKSCGVCSTLLHKVLLLQNILLKVLSIKERFTNIFTIIIVHLGSKKLTFRPHYRDVKKLNSRNRQMLDQNCFKKRKKHSKITL